MVSRNNFAGKSFFYILFAAFVLWIILFEFIFPANNFLPAPRIVILSIPALFNDYHLIVNFFETISVVYLPPLLAYLFLYFIRGSLFSQSVSTKFIMDFLSQIPLYFPAILVGILFILWFPDSFAFAYFFSFIVSLYVVDNWNEVLQRINMIRIMLSYLNLLGRITHL